MNLKIIEDVNIEPVSITEAKAHLRITHNNEDTNITRLIKVARKSAESITNMSLASKVYEYTINSFPKSIRLPMPPVESVTWIKYKDTDGAEYTLDDDYYISYLDIPARIIPAYDREFPDIELYPIGGVKIRYTAGYKTTGNDKSLIIPEDIKQAILLLVSDYYEYREDLLSRGHIPKTIPFGVKALLIPHKNWRF